MGRLRQALYFAGWIGIGALLAAVLGALTPRPIGQTILFIAPLALFYAFACLSAWYVSRATPLRTSSLFRVLASSGLAASIASGLWLGLARAWVAVLSTTATFAPAADRYGQQMPPVFAIGVLLFLLALAVHYVLIAFETTRQAERRQLELEILTRDAELRALRAQIDPHFLYNSLNSISALTASDSSGARRMCLLLGEFLRNTLDVSARQRIPLADELALAERFLSIEQVRFGSRLRIERRVDDASSACLVPPLLLQPLVENAVTHGIAQRIEGGVIRLDVSRTNGHLAIVLENPRDGDAAVPRPGGLGLENVRRRLTAMFGREASLETHAAADRFRVELHLPCSTGE